MKLRKMLLVYIAVERNAIDRIESLCQEALTQDPCDYFALETLADVYWRNEMHEKALPIALRTLEITPNDFCALRVAVHAYIDRGENDTAYLYAKRLCTAVPYMSSPCEELPGLLKLFSWIPVIRRICQDAIKEQEARENSRCKWTQWAQDFVASFEQ